MTDGDVLAIVGSRNITRQQENLVVDLVDAFLLLHFRWAHSVISGGAEGVDKIGICRAEVQGFHTKEILPLSHDWTGYRNRNLQIAKECTHLLCIRSQQSTTYGSAWTATQAEAMGKKVWRYYV